MKEHSTEKQILIEEITPEKARNLLEKNTGNFRKIDKKRVESYRKDIESGNWTLTGDSIKVHNGLLIDGQHRLEAVVAAGKPIMTAVAYNLSAESLHVDRGKPRSFAQWLAHDGIVNASHVAACTRLTLQHDKGSWDQHGMAQDKYNDTEMLDYVHRNDISLANSVRLGMRCYKILPTSIASTIVHIGSGRSQHPEENDLVTWFFHSLITGEDLKLGDAPFALRNRLLESRSSPAKKISASYMRWLATIAWNRYLLGQEVKLLRLRFVGPNRDQIPKRILSTDEI